MPSNNHPAEKSLFLGFLFLIILANFNFCVTVPEEEYIQEDLEEESQLEEKPWINFNPFGTKNKP